MKTKRITVLDNEIEYVDTVDANSKTIIYEDNAVRKEYVRNMLLKRFNDFKLKYEQAYQSLPVEKYEKRKQLYYNRILIVDALIQYTNQFDEFKIYNFIDYAIGNCDVSYADLQKVMHKIFNYTFDPYYYIQEKYKSVKKPYSSSYIQRDYAPNLIESMTYHLDGYKEKTSQYHYF